MANVHGSCLCKTIRWTYHGRFDRLTHCHCAMCRKAHGAPFASYAIGDAANYVLLSGEHAKVGRESSPGFVRSFCRECGSVLPNSDLGEIVAIPAGGLDSNPGVSPSAHIFAKWKAPWYAITDDLTQHDHYPGQAAPAVERAIPAPSTDGCLRGSCLCGRTAYALSGEFSAVHHCHCARCRKARAAAHTTNGLVALDSVRFTQGLDALKTYRVPDAEHFGQTFCGDCGSAMPFVNKALNVAVIPFGSLDDEPARGADYHVFVGSKSSWYPITDSLPQFVQAAPK